MSYLGYCLNQVEEECIAQTLRPLKEHSNNGNIEVFSFSFFFFETEAMRSLSGRTVKKKGFNLASCRYSLMDVDLQQSKKVSWSTDTHLLEHRLQFSALTEVRITFNIIGFDLYSHQTGKAVLTFT